MNSGALAKVYYKDVERKLAEAMGDAVKGFVYDDENQTVAEYMER